MTSSHTTITADRIEPLAGQIAAARHVSGPADQRTALILLRLLARGAPVAPAQLSEAVDLPVADVENTLEGWPEAFRDDSGQVIAFMGLSLAELGEHRLHLDGRILAAWCAWDTLFLPGLLGEPARVSSRCPTTGTQISLNVTAAGPTDPSPPTVVLSFLEPASKFDTNVIGSFCHHVHFFASPDAATTWTDSHPGTFQLTLEDAWQLARLTNQATFGVALAATDDA